MSSLYWNGPFGDDDFEAPSEEEIQIQKQQDLETTLQNLEGFKKKHPECEVGVCVYGDGLENTLSLETEIGTLQYIRPEGWREFEGWSTLGVTLHRTEEYSVPKGLKLIVVESGVSPIPHYYFGFKKRQLEVCTLLSPKLEAHPAKILISPTNEEGQWWDDLAEKWVNSAQQLTLPEEPLLVFPQQYKWKKPNLGNYQKFELAGQKPGMVIARVGSEGDYSLIVTSLEELPYILEDVGDFYCVIWGLNTTPKQGYFLDGVFCYKLLFRLERDGQYLNVNKFCSHSEKTPEGVEGEIICEEEYTDEKDNKTYLEMYVKREEEEE